MNTLARVKSILCDRLRVSPNEVLEDSDLREDLGADSLDLVEVGMDLEDEFGILVSDEDIEKFVTVEDIVEFVTE